MALEWVVLGYTAGAEAIMLLFLILLLFLNLPVLDSPRKGPDSLRGRLIAVTRNALKPLMSVVPFCLFLLMDIYWKYETKMSICEDHENCSPHEHLRHEKSMIKIQRNLLLIGAALLLYWLLFTVTELATRLESLNQQVKKLKKAN